MSTTAFKSISALAIACVLTFQVSAQTASNGLTKQGNDFQLRGTLTQNTTIDLGASYFFKLSKSTQDYLTVINNGNIGIGTNNPQYKLDVNGTMRATGNVGIGTGNTTVAPDGSARVLQIGSQMVMQNVVGNQGMVANNAYFNGSSWKYVNTGAAQAVRLNQDFDGSNISFHVSASGTGGSTLSNWDGSDIRLQLTPIGAKFSSLKTSATAPSTTGATKMVITDANGLLSFDNIPSGSGSTIINNNGANRIITGSSTANTLDAQTDLTFSNGHLSVTQSADAAAVSVTAMNVYNSNAINAYVPANGKAFVVQSIEESAARSVLYGDGAYGIGPGNASRDIFLDRPSTSKLRISSDRGTGAASLLVTGLATGLTPPSTTGTTKMVVTDQNGLLSFTNIPLGGSVAGTADGQIQFKSSSSLAASASLIWDDGNKKLSVSGSGFMQAPTGTFNTLVLQANSTQNGTGGTTDGILVIRNLAGTQTAHIREDGFIAGKVVGSEDNSTVALTDYNNSSCTPGADFNSLARIVWSNGTNWWDSKDLGMSRNAAGLLEINNGIAGTLRDLKLRNFIATSLAGTGLRMVVADGNGLLSTQAIPSGGGTISLSSTQVAYGSTGNTVTSNPNLTFDGTTLLVNGNIGIGTNTNGYRFAVNGNAIFTKVKVKEYTSWPDYVFGHDYKLRSLKEVEAFIKQHKHLPEVLSAEEIKKEGLDIGDNQALLLKKIEELTLYAIEQQKEIDTLKKQNDSIEELRKELERIKKMVSEQ